MKFLQEIYDWLNKSPLDRPALEIRLTDDPQVIELTLSAFAQQQPIFCRSRVSLDLIENLTPAKAEAIILGDLLAGWKHHAQQLVK